MWTGDPAPDPGPVSRPGRQFGHAHAGGLNPSPVGWSGRRAVLPRPTRAPYAPAVAPSTAVPAIFARGRDRPPLRASAPGDRSGRRCRPRSASPRTRFALSARGPARRRGGGRRAADPAARPGRPRGLGGDAAPGHVRDGRAGRRRWPAIPFLPEVGWSWLTDALDHAGARYKAAGGYGHPDPVDPLRRPVRPARLGRHRDPRLLDPGRPGPRGAPRRLVHAARLHRRAAAAGGRPAQGTARPRKLDPRLLGWSTAGPPIRLSAMQAQPDGGQRGSRARSRLTGLRPR